MSDDHEIKTLQIEDEEGIERVAKQLGVPVERVRNTILFSMAVHAEVRERDLSVQQALSGLMSVVGDVLRHNIPFLERAEVATDIYQVLWGACGLPTDATPQERIYGTKGTPQT